MRGIWAAAALALALLLASWMWLHGLNAENRATGQAVAALYDFVQAESDLQRNVLSARAGILRNYDPIVADIAEMRVATDRLGGAFATEVQALAAMVTAAEAITERFKSGNALLQNSLAYFATLSERLQTSDLALARSINGLSTAVLNLTLDTSPAAVARVDARIDLIPADARLGPTLDALVSHAVQLRTLIPETDAGVEALARLGAGGEVRTVRAAILARQGSVARRADTVRWLLYGLTLVLVGLLAVVGARLRGRVRALRHRAAIEHVVAKISMRFLDTPTWKMDAQLALALDELAAAFGAVRAYLVLPGVQSSRTIATTELPPGWADRAVAVMAAAGKGDGGIVHFEHLRSGEFPAAPGVRAWLCIARFEDGHVRALLGLEGRRPGTFRKFDSGKLLALAFNALTGAMGRSALEQERARLETSLARAQRMETIGVFASGIAHNFNNIVGAVLGHAEMAATAAAPESRLAGHIRAIQIAGGRASELVDQLLTFGRRRDGARNRVDVDDLVAEAVLLMQSMLAPDVRLVVAERSGAAVGSAEPHQLGQVVLNLLRNAAQAIEGPGTIAVSVAAHDVTAARRLGADALEPGRYVMITVEDDGRGMDAATLRSIFEPFFTTREAGNGLGLATAREIVRNHHGAIGVTSTPAVGTRFEVFLPAFDPAEAGAGAGALGAERGEGDTVLLLDPDDDRRLRLEDALAALEYEPVGFADLSAAVAACRAEAGRFDAVFVCDGTAGSDDLTPACDELHRAAPRLPIILATGASHARGAEALVRAGVTAVVPLPPSYALLSAALATAVAPRSAATLPDGSASYAA